MYASSFNDCWVNTAPDWDFKSHSIYFLEFFLMLQQSGYIQKGISIQSVYLDHKKHERNLLVAETYPKSILLFFLSTHWWHFLASLKFSCRIWLSQWNVNKSEKHHSRGWPPESSPAQVFGGLGFFFFLSSDCLRCWWPHNYLRSHIGDGRGPFPWVPEWLYGEGLPINLFTYSVVLYERKTKKPKANKTK